MCELHKTGKYGVFIIFLVSDTVGLHFFQGVTPPNPLQCGGDPPSQHPSPHDVPRAYFAHFARPPPYKILVTALVLITIKYDWRFTIETAYTER